MDEQLIITKAYDLILYLVPQIAKLPRQQRYTLGERIESMSLDFLSLLSLSLGLLKAGTAPNP